MSVCIFYHHSVRSFRATMVLNLFSTPEPHLSPTMPKKSMQSYPRKKNTHTYYFQSILLEVFYFTCRLLLLFTFRTGRRVARRREAFHLLSVSIHCPVNNFNEGASQLKPKWTPIQWLEPRGREGMWRGTVKGVFFLSIIVHPLTNEFVFMRFWVQECDGMQYYFENRRN